MKEAVFVHDPRLSEYQLSENHPFKPVRHELTRSLLRHAGLLQDAQEVALEPLDEAELLTVHDPAYVAVVKAVSRGEPRREALAHGLGTGDNPIFPQMHDAILRVCAATVTALEQVASGRARRALSLAGGLHHAHADKASGFCLYNDLAVAMTRAARRYGMRVAYVDLDAHHGDGVQWLFYERPDVLTVSLHESGRYLFPGTGHTFETGRGAGRGTSVNAPLEPFTEDESFLEVFEAVVPVALRAFEPDVIVLQAGADMHALDPLADLKLSVRGMAASYRRMSELADELCGGRLVATGGGGYDPYRTVPRAWAALWAALSRQALPEALPDAWRREWAEKSPVPLPETLHGPDVWEAVPRRAAIAAHNRATARRLMESLALIWEERAV